MNYKLSVIIPTYGRSDSLSALLESLLHQTLSNIEIIVVDQNPIGILETSLTSGLLEQVSYLHLTKPNASSARNAGYLISKGEYLLFIDDDLLPTSNFCEQALTVFKKYSQIACLCPIVYVEESDQLDIEKKFLIYNNIPETNLYQIKETISAAVFFESTYFQKSGGFDEVLFEYARTAEDQELFLRMANRGMKIWLDTDLRIFHDETVPGGCELRSDHYWNTREKCVKSWAFRYRIHGGRNGQLALSDILQLARSSFLNRNIVHFPPQKTWQEITTLHFAIKDSRTYLAPYQKLYPNVCDIDHLTQHKISAERIED